MQGKSKKTNQRKRETSTKLSNTSTRERENIVLDQDGVQQVKSRKNTRRNIFAGELEAGHGKTRNEIADNHLRTFGAAAPTAAHNNTEKIWRNVDTESKKKKICM